MIHRVVFGSIERFIGILTEHFAGAFPIWLAPVQIRLLPITDRHLDYCYQIKKEAERRNIRAEVDERNEKSVIKSGKGNWREFLICWWWEIRKWKAEWWPFGKEVRRPGSHPR